MMKRKKTPKHRRRNSQRSRDVSSRYTFQIEWNVEQSCHRAKCVMLPSLRAHGKTPEAALKNIMSAVAKELRSQEERGEQVPLPIYKQVGGY